MRDPIEHPVLPSETTSATHNPPVHIVPENMTDDGILDFTKKVRVVVVKDILAKGVPQETSDRMFLTNMLSGLDSQAISNKRVAADTKVTDTASATIAQLLRTLDRSTAFRAVEGEVVDVTSKEIPDGIENEFSAQHGEMDVNPPQMDYQSFVKKQGKNVDDVGKGFQDEGGGE